MINNGGTISIKLRILLKRMEKNGKGRDVNEWIVSNQGVNNHAVRVLQPLTIIAWNLWYFFHLDSPLYDRKLQLQQPTVGRKLLLITFFCKVCPRLGMAIWLHRQSIQSHNIRTQMQKVYKDAKYCTLNSGWARGCAWPDGQDSHWNGREVYDGQDHQD